MKKHATELTGALVTLSFRGDLERCRLLCESVDRFVDYSLEHLLVVDRRDAAMFAPLAVGRRRIVVAEDHLPWWVRRVPGSRRWWASAYSWPIRNWIIQQILKLSFPSYCDADVAIFVDSDVIFLRPFSMDLVVDQGCVRLMRRPGAAQHGRHLKWHGAARRLLGLPGQGYLGSDYIGNLITWRRENVLALQEHVANRCVGPWQSAIARHLHFSEYILYGAFCEFVLGQDSGHYSDASDLCHCSWDYQVDAHNLRDFLDQIDPHHVAVLVQSNLRLDTVEYQSHVREAQVRLNSQAEHEGAGSAKLDVARRT